MKLTPLEKRKKKICPDCGFPQSSPIKHEHYRNNHPEENPKLQKLATVYGIFGSDFQKESALGALEIVLGSWQHFYLGTNKKNNFIIIFDFKNGGQ